MVLHDINQTIYFSDKIIGLQGGHVAIEGTPDQVITEESIQKLYGVHLMVTRVNGSPVVAIQDYRLPPREKITSVMNRKDKEMKKNPMNIIWMLLGFLCLAFGTIGIVLPILPTVPLYMATVFCFAKSSEKLHTWFLSTGLYKKASGQLCAGKSHDA